MSEIIGENVLQYSIVDVEDLPLDVQEIIEKSIRSSGPFTVTSSSGHVVVSDGNVVQVDGNLVKDRRESLLPIE